MRLRLFILLIVATWLATWLGTGSAHAEKRVALVMGNSAYKNVAKLANPANDAALVGGMFKKAGFDAVDVKLDLNVVDMRKALREFGSKAREADVAVIYYAGHGIELDGTNYLIPTDATLETDTDVLDEAFPLDRVLFAIEPAKQLRLVILDACRDNPFAKTMKRTVASRAIGRGLAKVEPTSPNTMIAFAAKAGSTASDGDAKNSPFATALVERLPMPGLDLRKAFGFVRDDVLKTTGYKQEPYVYGSLGGDDVSLVPARPVAAPGPQANPQDSVRRDYELALQLGTRDGWTAFLNRFPSGFYADLAKGQLNKIAAEETRAAAAEMARQAEDEKARLASERARKAEQEKAAAAA
ncbi:MAG: caspase family protein, partial [Bradyrhizobium sp.]|nr:caspase family protein [Bradyrhizobium sp.]